MTTGGWETVRTAVGQRVGEAAFEAWIRTLDGRLEGETLVLRCPDRFTRDWVRSRFGRTIEECAPAARSVEYRVDPGALAPPRARAEPVAEPSEPSCAQEQLFERFVVGPGSALALEASRAVARGEAGRRRPLLLLGGTGAGLVARIAPPEAEPRGAILRERAARGGVRVPDECLELLAARELASVRDLIGGLNQVVARASLLRAPITPELVAQALDAVEMPGRARSIGEIVLETARAYGLAPEALRSRARGSSPCRRRSADRGPGAGRSPGESVSRAWRGSVGSSP